MAELILRKSWAVNLKLSCCTRTKTIVFGILTYLYNVNLLIIFYIKLLKIKSRNLVDQISNVFFVYLSFLLRTFMVHRTAVERGDYHLGTFLPLQPVSQTLRHWADDYCREHWGYYCRELGVQLEPGFFGFRTHDANQWGTRTYGFMSLMLFLSQFLTLNLSLVIYVSKKLVVK